MGLSAWCHQWSRDDGFNILCYFLLDVVFEIFDLLSRFLGEQRGWQRFTVISSAACGPCFFCWSSPWIPLVMHGSLWRFLHTLDGMYLSIITVMVLNFYQSPSGVRSLFSARISMFFHFWFRADSRFAPSQWETALLCNDVSYWLGANLQGRF